MVVVMVVITICHVKPLNNRIVATYYHTLSEMLNCQRIICRPIHRTTLPSCQGAIFYSQPTLKNATFELALKMSVDNAFYSVTWYKSAKLIVLVLYVCVLFFSAH